MLAERCGDRVALPEAVNRSCVAARANGEAIAQKIALTEQRRAKRARSKRRYAFWSDVAARIKSGCIRAREPQVLRAPRTVKAGAAAPASAVKAVRRVVALVRAFLPVPARAIMSRR